MMGVEGVVELTAPRLFPNLGAFPVTEEEQGWSPSLGWGDGSLMVKSRRRGQPPNMEEVPGALPPYPGPAHAHSRDSWVITRQLREGGEGSSVCQVWGRLLNP